MQRPWQGQTENLESRVLPKHDPLCYLCAGNSRSGGSVNPDYSGVFIFNNDYPALLSETAAASMGDGGLFQAQSERGVCRVVCFSPRHDLTVAELDVSAIEDVIRAWGAEYEALGKMDFINHVQIFENKGSMMGCSNPHPHGQIWAQESIPNEPLKKLKSQREYFVKNNSLLLRNYLDEELQRKDRIVFENNSFVSLVPFWATWPFETILIPKKSRAHLNEMEAEEISDLAVAYQRTAILYDNLFQSSAPYSAGIHQAPTDGKDHSYYQMHMVFYPPLLRSASIKKFMVGYEMLGEAQRDLTAEYCAKVLRELPAVRYG
jgi:UDPglucose--hexose-1-phosphate uridylyltransferase